MEKYSSTIVLIFLCLLRLGHCNNPDSIFVHGMVYCDNCHVGFPTTSSKVIAGAEVHLECSDHKGGEVTYSQWRRTNSEGLYDFEVGHDNLDSFCEIIPLESHLEICRNLVHEDSRQEVKIRHTNPNPADNRVVAFGNKRFATPIAFQPDEPRPECAEQHNEEEHMEEDHHESE